MRTGRLHGLLMVITSGLADRRFLGVASHLDCRNRCASQNDWFCAQIWSKFRKYRNYICAYLQLCKAAMWRFATKFAVRRFRGVN